MLLRLLAGCAADGRWTGAIGLLLGSVVDSFQAFPGSKVPRLATKRVAGSWHLPQRREEQPPLASPSSSRGSLPFLLGWLGCACGLCLSLLAATADPLVPDVQLEEFGLAAAAASSRAGCRRGMGQMGGGQLAPSQGWNASKQHGSRGQLLVSSTDAILDGGKKERGRNTYRTYRVSVVIWLRAAVPAMAAMPSATAAISRRTGG